MIIDGHVHVTLDGWAAFDAEKAHSLGLDACLCYSGAWADTGVSMELARAQNDNLARLRSETGMVAPFGTVHPIWGEAAAQEMERCIRTLGFPGAAFNPHQAGYMLVRQHYNLKSNLFHSPIFEVLRDTRAPVVFDCDYLADYSSPAQLGEMARRLPDNPIIMGHSGWNAMWPMAIEVAARTDNLFFETASVPTGGIKLAVQRLGADRVIFGSDFPCDNGHTVAYELRKIRSLGLTPADEALVLGGNLWRMGILSEGDGRRWPAMPRQARR